MGAPKTVGRGWVAPEGLPSAVAMETVGREAIVVVDVDGEVEVRRFPQFGITCGIFRLLSCSGRGSRKP